MFLLSLRSGRSLLSRIGERDRERFGERSRLAPRSLRGGEPFGERARLGGDRGDRDLTFGGGLRLEGTGDLERDRDLLLPLGSGLACFLFSVRSLSVVLASRGFTRSLSRPR